MGEFLVGGFGLAEPTTLEISGGAITITQSKHIIAAQTGTADELDTINIAASLIISAAGNTYQPMLFIQADTGDTITVKHTTGGGTNISLSGGIDFTLSGEKQLFLFYNGTFWTDAGTGAIASASSTKSFAFLSSAGSAGTWYAGGFYNFAATHDDFNPAINFGTANAAYGAHILFVLGANTVDTITIRVTGTSMTHAGVRTAADTENVVFTHPALVDDYKETEKHWIGQVAIEVIGGTAKDCNYGHVNAWRNNEINFTVKGLECTWLGGANDATPDIKLRHHKFTGWTYNAGAEPTPPTELASMATDYNTEIQVRNNEEGSWIRDNLGVAINADNEEGIFIELVTTSNAAFALGNIGVRIEQ